MPTATDRPGETTLDHLLTVLAAPAAMLCDPDGQVRAEGAQGRDVGDTRCCSRLEPGAGHLDRPAFVAAPARTGHTGDLAAECRLSGPAGRVLPKAATTLRAAGAGVA
jgi:hypothetical protein